MSPETCQFCKYFTAVNEKAGGCRRYPPHPFPAEGGGTVSIWPSVQLHQSCGEWRQGILLAQEIPPSQVIRQ